MLGGVEFPWYRDAVAVIPHGNGQRDLQDTSRADSPLHVAEGSVVVDTTTSSLDEVVDRLLSELQRISDLRLDTTGENTIRSRNHGGLVRGRSAPIEEESS